MSTFVEEYHGTRDRSRWPAGQWDAELDKAVWVDEATGLDCMIVRNRIGALCGYVGVGPGHPWHAISYSGCIDSEMEHDGDWHYECSPDGRVGVHGGLTYSDLCRPSDDGPAEGVCHLAQPGRPESVWWFGFDCAHSGDLTPGLGDMGGDAYRDVAYVMAEVRSLAAQLKAVAA